LDARGIFDLLAARFGEDVHGFTEAAAADGKEGPRDAFLVVRPGRLVEVMTALLDDPALAFDFLQNLTAIDWIKEGAFHVVYHLFSYRHRHEVVVKVVVPRAQPRLPSLAALWRNADWLEREQYDLLGVVFEGHPDLRRLLLPDDWVGHPMRKDYREAAEYRGMPTTRPSAFDLLLAHDQHQKAKPPS
jgi:NADH-quinone oxidoreductase subunit C